MGRAIDQDNRLDDHDRRLKLVEDALEELIQTRVHHVDLHGDAKNVVAEGTELKPDEEFAPRVGKRKIKKSTKKSALVL